MNNSQPNPPLNRGTVAAASPTASNRPAANNRNDVAVSGPPQQPTNPRSPPRQQPQLSQPPPQQQQQARPTPPRHLQHQPPPQPLLLPDPLPWECPLCHHINDAIQPRCANQIPPSSPAGYLTDCRGLRPTLQPPQRPPQFQPRTQHMQYQPTIQSSKGPRLYTGTPRTLSASDGQFSHQSQPPPFQSPNQLAAPYSGEGHPSNAGAQSPSFSSTSPRMQPPSYELTQFQPQPIGPPGGMRAPVEGEPTQDPGIGGAGVGYPTIAGGFDPRYHQPPPSHSVAIYDPNHPQFSGQVMHPQYQAARVVMDANAQATLARLEFLEEQNRRQAYVFRQHQESIVRIRMARAFFALLAIVIIIIISIFSTGSRR